mgnify:CR=1 FL=1
MTPHHALERNLAELADASETLLQQLRRRDPGYLESLERRAMLLETLAPLCAQPAAAPGTLAALERIRQLGEACEREAQLLREEALAMLATVERHARFAESLQRLAAPREPSLLNIRG